MRQNLSVHWQTQGEYATDLFTRKAIDMIKRHDQNEPMYLFVSHLSPHAGNEFDPLQAPESEIAKYPYIADKSRRTYAAMVSKLDTSIGDVVQALEKKGMLDNSVLLFFSDNGAPIAGE